jgi:hypothetical protein
MGVKASVEANKRHASTVAGAMANAISKLAIGSTCAIALFFGCFSHRSARAESLTHDPDAHIDRISGVRDERGRMDRLDIELVDLFPRFGDRTPSMAGVSLGYRILPELTTGLYFDAMFVGASVPDDDPCHQSGDCFERHVRFGTFALMHLLPDSFFDPWISIGAGGTTFQKLGADGSATVGIDMRIGNTLAIGPLFTRTQTLAGPQPSWNGVGIHALLTF